MDKLLSFLERYGQERGTYVKAANTSAETKFGGSDWSADPSGRGYRSGVQNAGGARAGRGYNLWRRIHVEELEDAFAKHAQGILDPRKRAKRVAAATKGFSDPEIDAIFKIADPDSRAKAISDYESVFVEFNRRLNEAEQIADPGERIVAIKRIRADQAASQSSGGPAQLASGFTTEEARYAYAMAKSYAELGVKTAKELVEKIVADLGPEFKGALSVPFTEGCIR